MLDAFIIEELKRREQRRDDRQRPVIELPLPSSEDRPRRSETEDDEQPQRGVVVIDLAV